MISSLGIGWRKEVFNKEKAKEGHILKEVALGLKKAEIVILYNQPFAPNKKIITNGLYFLIKEIEELPRYNGKLKFENLLSEDADAVRYLEYAHTYAYELSTSIKDRIFDTIDDYTVQKYGPFLTDFIGLVKTLTLKARGEEVPDMWSSIKFKRDFLYATHPPKEISTVSETSADIEDLVLLYTPMSEHTNESSKRKYRVMIEVYDKYKYALPWGIKISSYIPKITCVMFIKQLLKNILCINKKKGVE